MQAVRELRQMVRGRPVVVRWDPGGQASPEALEREAHGILSRIASHPTVEDAARIPAGWSTVVLRSISSELVCCEPCFSANAADELQEGVSVTVSIAALQGEFHARVGCENDHCSWDDLISVAQGILEQPELCLHRRLPRRDGHSGWVAGPADPEAMLRVVEEGRLLDMPTWQLVSRRRAHLIEVLAMPVATRVWFRDQEAVRVLDGEGRDRTHGTPGGPTEEDFTDFMDCAEDHSNDLGFEYEFRCPRCGESRRSTLQVYDPGVTGHLGHALKQVGGRLDTFTSALFEAGGSILHKHGRPAQAQEAYRRAILECRKWFGRCTGCAVWYCRDSCWSEKTGLCASCGPSAGGTGDAAVSSEPGVDTASTRRCQWCGATGGPAGSCPACGARM